MRPVGVQVVGGDGEGVSCGIVEATTGFEPVNRGFADPRVEPLHHVAPMGRAAPSRGTGCPSRIRTSVHGSKVRCPTTRRRGSGALGEGYWSGRRDSNPRPSPWQGDALPTEPLPLDARPLSRSGAEGQDRTGDTAIFSRVLYRLSYLGPMVALRAAVGGPQDTTALPAAAIEGRAGARGPVEHHHVPSDGKRAVSSHVEHHMFRATPEPAVSTVSDAGWNFDMFQTTKKTGFGRWSEHVMFQPRKQSHSSR